jgi:hypothetical protein
MILRSLFYQDLPIPVDFTGASRAFITLAPLNNPA